MVLINPPDPQLLKDAGWGKGRRASKLVPKIHLEVQS